MTLFDYGGIPDFKSTDLCQMLLLTSNSPNHRITIIDNKETAVVGEVNRVPITVGSVTFELSCLVVETKPYHLIIESPSMKTMHALLDFENILSHSDTEMG